MTNVVCWSGGKDSTATIILAHEHNIPIDLILMSVVWFDKKNNIYGEHPEHINWVLNYAKPLFESWGYVVELVSSDRDYLYWFNKKFSEKSKYYGKRYGWLIGGKCNMNGEKVLPIKNRLNQIPQPMSIFDGIAYDEPIRLARMHKKENHISLLEEYKITEKQAVKLCQKYKLLSPIYDNANISRQGCWFCPNASIKAYAYVKTHHYELWEQLEKLSKKDDIMSGFKYGKPFDAVNNAVDLYIKQQDSQKKLF